MSLLNTLIRNDFLSLRSWFAKQAFSKAVVALVYMLVLALVGIGVYSWSSIFFNYILEYREYGELTIHYIVRGAYIILVWLGILSSFFVTVNFLLSPNRYTDLLLTYPIPDFLISLRNTFRSLAINFSLLLVSVFPLTVAFNQVLDPAPTFWTFIGPLFSFIVVLLLSESIGSAFGYLFAFFVRKKWGVLMTILFGSGFLAATVFVIRLVFPPQLSRLPDISAVEFNSFFSGLPLMSRCWLAEALTGSAIGIPLSIALLSLITLIFVLISYFVQMYLFIPCYQASKVHLATLKKTQPVRSFKRVSLMSKDLLSIYRSPRDLGYLFFLLIMIIAFFGLFSQGYVLRGVPQRFHFDALAFSFGWLVFFSGTYLLRFSFPLMVNEGRSRWWFFTLPVIPVRLMLSKVFTSLILASPLLLIGLTQWYILPYSVSPGLLTAFSLIGIIFLAITIPLIGFMSPDFSLSYDPDRASTSFTGLISIVLVAATGVFGGVLISMSLRGALEWPFALNTFLGYCLVLAGAFWIVAINSYKKYTIDI